MSNGQSERTLRIGIARESQEDIEAAKNAIKDKLKVGQKIEDLDDKALFCLMEICEKELSDRKSPYTEPGRRRRLFL
jgi:hypothetical protein